MNTNKESSDDSFAWISPSNRILYISGMISQAHTAAALRFVLMLGEEAGTVVVNSAGGDESEGFALYDLLRPLSKQLTAVAIGQCQSAAILPYLACSERYASKHTNFMFHHGTASFQSDEPTREWPGISRELIRSDEAYLKVITERTALTLKETRKLCRFGHYFGFEEAVKNGFVSYEFGRFRDVKERE